MQSTLTVPDEPRAVRPARLTSILVVAIWLTAVLAQVGAFNYLIPVNRYKGLAGRLSWLATGDFVLAALNLLLATLGALIVLRAAHRRIGWIILAAGLSLAVVSLASEYSQYALLVVPQSGLPLVLFAAWLQDFWTIPTFLLFFVLPVLFPDGYLPSPRWRAAFWPALAAWLLFILAFALARRPLANEFLELPPQARPANPYGIIPLGATAINAAFGALIMISTVTGVGSVIFRWRHTSGDVRQQIKWVLYALLLMLGTVGANAIHTGVKEWAGVDLGIEAALAVAGNLFPFAVVVALGIAVFRYRLYDIDLIINRTLVYGALTAIIVTSYVLFVAGVGALLPLENNLFLSLLATGVIAVLFNPLRQWLQRQANRLMFGQRDDPYAVLSELGRLLSSSGRPETTLNTIVETIAASLRLPYAAIQLEHRGAYTTRAAYGSSSDEQLIIPLMHQNELVGRLVVSPRVHGDSLPPSDRQLLDDIAHHMGAVAYAVRLTAALQHARETLVLAREEERRRIRRDLHDGLGPSLASQTFKLDAALDLLQQNPQAVVLHLQALKEQTQRLVADVRRLVYELRPPALDELGLAGALSAQAGQMNSPNGLRIRVVTKPEPLPALPAAVEVAAYRIALEAITNVVRHAHARECTVVLEAKNGQLAVTVSDDGVGLPPGTETGVGLASMRERAEELGGSLAVGASGPDGTRVTAVLPLTHSYQQKGPSNHDEWPAATVGVDGVSHG